MDLQTNRQICSFLGITGHFISRCWKLESVILGCNRVVELDIAEKLKHVITDSWANVKKAFVTLPGYEEDDLVDSDELNNGDEEEEQKDF